MAQIIDPTALKAENMRAKQAQAKQTKPAPRSPAPPKTRRNGDFSLANQRTDVMNSASSAAASLTADGYWIIRRLLRGEYVTQENSGLAPTEWRSLMQQLGREASPA